MLLKIDLDVIFYTGSFVKRHLYVVGEHIKNYKQNPDRCCKNNIVITHICLTGGLSIFMKDISECWLWAASYDTWEKHLVSANWDASGK